MQQNVTFRLSVNKSRLIYSLNKTTYGGTVDGGNVKLIRLLFGI